MISFTDAARRFNARHAARVLPILILLLAAGLRLHLLGNQSLWNDEGNSLRLAERPIGELIAAAAQDIHPPGYYLALKAWRALTGESEFALRALSALAGILTVACVYALGKALFAAGTGLIAAGLLAINSFAIYYSQEARMYAALALLAAASLLVFVRWTARPTWPYGLVLALLNAAGLYTHYTYPAIMLVQGILVVVSLLRSASSSPNSERRPGGEVSFLPRFILLNLLTLILFLPMLPTTLHQISQWPRTGQPIDVGTGVSTVVRWLVYGNTSLAAQWWVYLWPLLFIIAAFLPDWIRRRQPFVWRLALPWIWILATVAPFFALGMFREANLKFLLPVVIAVALLIARGAWLLWEIGSPNIFILLEAIPRLAAGFGLLSLVMLSSDALDNLYHVEGFARDDYRGMAHLISADQRPADAIVLDAPNQQEVFSYYYHGATPVFPLPKGLGGDDAATRRAIQQVIHDHRRIYVLFWGEGERDPNRVIETELNAATYPVWSRWYGHVRLALYVVPHVPAAVPTRQLDTNFGDLIKLQGIALDADKVQVGDVLGVTLFWQAEQPIPKRYKVFIQLLDGEGRLVAQRDSEPNNNISLTTRWTPGQTVIDSHGLLIPPTLSPGDYQLILGLYDIDNPAARLPVNGGDHVNLGVVRVQS